VLEPILRPGTEGRGTEDGGRGPDEGEDPDDDFSPQAVALRALKEIEFDRATGKLSDADYAELRRTYADRAVRELRGAASPGEPTDPIEARVREYRLTRRECPTCGLRPEPDAIYCSSCGGYLDRVCPQCAGEINEASAAFCSRCGVTLSHQGTRVFA